MKVMCVDDEPLMLETIEMLLQSEPEIGEIAPFLNPKAALQWAGDHCPDAAFLDISMGQMDGLVLAQKLKTLCPECAIVFITGHSEYAVSAFALRADGYLLKPITKEDVHGEIAFIRSKKEIPCPPARHRVRMQCFGNFEVFSEGMPLRFERKKTKELLAYLVDRQGASASMGELIGILWEDAPDSVSTRCNLRNLIHDLKSTLCEYGEENILIKDRNAIALNCSAVDCDFYDFQKRMPYAVNMYRGEYMSQYAWAEITMGRLDT